MEADLVGERVVLTSLHGYEIHGTLIGLVTEPSFLIEEDDGRRVVYGRSVTRAIALAAGRKEVTDA